MLIGPYISFNSKEKIANKVFYGLTVSFLSLALFMYIVFKIFLIMNKSEVNIA